MASNSVTIKILGDASSLKRSIGDAERDVGKLEKAGSKVSGAFKAMAGGIAAAGIGTLFKGALDAAAESQKVAKQTDAVLKSTGGSAGVTADHVGKLAHSLQNLSGVQDESIQTGQNMLLTFTNVRNGVGKGNDIFDQASKTMLDMSVAMGTDSKQAAMQLGKALNDPIKGIGALSRVGVTFTDQQKDQIKMMVAAGDTAGAQKVILAELNKEFGGSAKAAGDAQTPMQRLGLAFGDLQETIGTKLLPVVEKVAKWLEKHQALIVPLAAVIGTALVAAFTAWAVSAATAAAATLAAAAPMIGLGAAVAALGAGIYLLVTHWDDVWKKVKAIVGSAVEWLVGIFKQIPGWIGDALKGLANIITAPYRAAFNAIAKLWNSTVGKLHFKVPGWVPGLGGKGFDVPDIPEVKGLARGGVIDRPTLALIGEDARTTPEIVTPERLMRRIVRDELVSAGGPREPVVINMKVEGYGFDIDTLADLIQRRINRTLPRVLTGSRVL